MPATEIPRAPEAVTDGGGYPRFGTYQGVLREVDLKALKGPYQVPLPQRLFKHKKWQYVQVATPEVIALFAIADITYTANAFVTVVDLAERRAIFDRGLLGLPGLTVVGNRPGEGLDARFRLPGASLACVRAEHQERYRIDLELGALPFLREGLSWHGEILAEGGPPALTVIAPVPGGVINVTQKWCGLLASGTIQFGARKYELDGGVAGIDYTNGYLARHTAWRWAMANGRLPDGTAIGFNLVEGFNESDPVANENALWLGSKIHPLERARFTFDKGNPLGGWHLQTSDGALDLQFRALAAHREDRDYKLVKSHFVQPIGLFHGTVRLPDRTLEIADLAGVTEDQDILW